MSTGQGGIPAPVRSPERPGPGPTPEALLRVLDLGVRRRVQGLLSGDFRSVSPGPGTELSRIRPYEAGDDVRLIDWNVTARTGEPHVRLHVAERNLTAWLLLDVSPSMRFGTADRRKADVAEGVALAVGHLSVRGGNRVGVLAFGDGDPRLIPPRGGRVGMLGLLETARRDRDIGQAATGATSVGDALDRVSRLAGPHSLVVVVSDFRGPRAWGPSLPELAARHDTVMVEIRDPREDELPDVGDLWLEDPETGRQLRVNTGDRRLRERFAAAAAAEREDLARGFRLAGADHAVLSTRGDWLGSFAGFLRRRKADAKGRR